ncbi:glutathione S-transferase family protein [Lysobacter sp. BMK333-48F3]|uniref:glutathione S-transferase family protein n=1 Tax=Lysobacter sp. BMK333-48F3 TaxID=2867962 RepID=UPI001C8BF081|nr:glutathione S-transferase family protein [Lysobacter sp. BMK333-48F3]MBX9400286.1 glutathione S-transferase family protein [Lysobacter sp. BMK333-48F3]
MKIYWIRTQAPRRVLALAKHLRLEVELVEKDLMAGELQAADYAALNPNRKAPLLVDGDYALWESSAIMAYLCRRAGSELWPSRADEQIEVLRWLSWNDQHWDPTVSPFYFERVVKPQFGIGEPDLDLLAASEAALHRYARVLDDHLTGRRHLACGRLTIADFQAASMACDWRQAQMPLHDYPHLLAWLEGLMALPAWAEPWPQAA